MDQTENTEYTNVSENKPSTSDMVTGNSPETAKKDTTGTRSHRFLAVLFAVLAVAGLFLGLLGNAWSAFAPTVFFTQYGATLSGSLIGYAIDFMRFMGTGVFYNAMHASAESALAALVELVLVFALILVTVFSVVACFAALFSKKYARKFALSSGTAVLLVYAGLFLWSYFAMGVAGVNISAACDVPTATVTVIALAALSFDVIASNKHCGANVAMLISSLLIAFLACYPGSLTMAVTGMGILRFGNNAFVKIALLFFMIVLAFNIVVSMLRLHSAKRYAFDSFRFALQLFCIIFMAIAFISDPVDGSTWAIFRGNQLFYTLGMLALAILALVVAVFIAVVTRRATLLKAYAETFPGFSMEEIAEREEQPAGETAPADDNSEWEVAMQAEGADGTYEGETPDAVFDEIELQEEAPMSEFERRMQALARGEQPDYTPASPNPPQQPQQQPPYAAPSRAGMPIQQRSMMGYADQYTYDPFINSLSPQEKNEFGDLFIACKAGKVEGLPIYKIGGNNEEFFRKVFIFLGKFRKDISAELLDKLYLYVSNNG